ncbi:unnamed protein product [Pleuronectes platessa]|uniref:Uncharacterized protein n=1 Tax=Pleuronectes platessa TaxID=8262 RepID=A0A9N7UQ36_PLEPL|nr:unnamed protein product [Pleuronectes platessa]
MRDDDARLDGKFQFSEQSPKCQNCARFPEAFPVDPGNGPPPGAGACDRQAAEHGGAGEGTAGSPVRDAGTVLGLSVGLQFTGSEGQWARYLRWDASSRSDLTFQFKTPEPEGLLLYFDDGGFCDFLLLAVSEGKMQLRVSIDCAETTITSDKMVNDSRWHFAAINRHNLRTGLAVDGQTKTEEVRPQRQFMKIISDLFLGGLPGDIRTSAITLPSVRELPPFKGIITDLSYGSKLPTLINSQKVRLEMMGLCTENPCENGGICLLADGEPYCDCSKTGYVGRYCTEALARWCRDLKRSCSELKSRALACGMVQDSTRCAGCRAVERTDWTCPLFASSHLLIACVEQSMEEKQAEEEEEEEEEEGHTFRVPKLASFGALELRCCPSAGQCLPSPASKLRPSLSSANVILPHVGGEAAAILDSPKGNGRKSHLAFTGGLDRNRLPAPSPR